MGDAIEELADDSAHESHHGKGPEKKIGLMIAFLALFLSLSEMNGKMHQTTGLNVNIEASDTWNFYQAKSIKQTIAENARDDAQARHDRKKVEELTVKIDRYESDPVKGEGKKELLAKARQLEADRDEAKKHSPWLTFAGSALQLSIVLLSAAILAVRMGMFWGSIGVGLVGIILMSQGVWLWI